MLALHCFLSKCSTNIRAFCSSNSHANFISFTHLKTFTTNTPYVALSSNTSVKYSSTPSILPSVFPTSLPSASPSVKPTISASTTLILVASYSHTALPSNYTRSIPTLVPSHRKFQKIILFHQLLLRLHL